MALKETPTLQKLLSMRDRAEEGIPLRQEEAVWLTKLAYAVLLNYFDSSSRTKGLLRELILDIENLSYIVGDTFEAPDVTVTVLDESGVSAGARAAATKLACTCAAKPNDPKHALSCPAYNGGVLTAKDIVEMDRVALIKRLVQKGVFTEKDCKVETNAVLRMAVHFYCSGVWDHGQGR